ncbi:MAG: hypothetical protein PHG54_08830 [Smithellaceae bacterium]|jgi:hypothetical protein|nr:hypothetical protein [Syntrophaceae bacterium]MDD4241520.1 hypothetical protein [Smithellaceae bacterium]NLX53108.1 hypothetical protein [Deltaproteobacteria bacterium]
MKSNRQATRLFFQALILVFFGLAAAEPAFATPPEDIQLKYNLATQTLSVTISHDTMLKGSHHVKVVKIQKNGAIVSINTYGSQPTGKTFTYEYKMPAIEEDTFVVTATCNMYGSKTSSMLTVMP